MHILEFNYRSEKIWYLRVLNAWEPAHTVFILMLRMIEFNVRN